VSRFRRARPGFSSVKAVAKNFSEALIIAMEAPGKGLGINPKQGIKESAHSSPKAILQNVF
jgi:hypothetical protein